MLVSVVSLKGAPGVTTFALGLAACWPTAVRRLLIEADPSGGDVATRFGLAPSGLVGLAAAARAGADPALPWAHAATLPGDLGVVAAPPDADAARATLAALPPGSVRMAADQPGSVVVLDCGRVDADSPAMPLIGSSDAMVLITGSRADELAHLAPRLATIARWSPRPLLLLAGEGYPVDEVERTLSVPPLGHIPDDEVGAALFCGRPVPRWRARREPNRTALGRFAHNVALVLRSALPIAPLSVPLQMAGSVPGLPPRLISASGMRPAPAEMGAAS
ncbi:chromosome partitioning protein [Actinokineospora sp. HUAS TT18]|uniref:chromosome partitioning protein n=1 Tax=Actinokineospora sp. HUAS TT18 TaxID=3447451 RepID=UPI003F51DAA7